MDPNLNSKSRSSTTFNPSEGLQECGVEDTYYMPSSDFNHLPVQIKDANTTQEPSLVDGAFCSKQNSSSTSSVSTRPHQVDAVHPFFSGYRSVKFDKSTSTDNQVFYCRQCEIIIELCQEAVNQHFVTTQHTPIEERCVYCNTAVYEYFYNENVFYYHRCSVESQQSNTSAKENSSDRPRGSLSSTEPVKSFDNPGPTKQSD